jgi:hypothetical protein
MCVSFPRRLHQRRRDVREENLQGDGTTGEERIQRLGGLEQLLPGRPLTVQGKKRSSYLTVDSGMVH